MSPKAKYHPTIVAKVLSHFGIALHITFNLRKPEILIAFYFILCGFPVIAVPKITVTKNRYFTSRKRNIRFPKHGLVIALECHYSAQPQFLAQNMFKSSITIPNTAHIIFNLLFALFSSHCTHRPQFSDNSDISNLALPCRPFRCQI